MFFERKDDIMNRALTRGIEPLGDDQIMNERLKVYVETSFVSYLRGRPTTREPIASWQAASRQWWAAVAPICDLFVSGYVIKEAKNGNTYNLRHFCNESQYETWNFQK